MCRLSPVTYPRCSGPKTRALPPECNMLKTVYLRMLLLLGVPIAAPLMRLSLDSTTRVCTFDDDSPQKRMCLASSWKRAEHAYKIVLVQGTTARSGCARLHPAKLR